MHTQIAQLQPIAAAAARRHQAAAPPRASLAVAGEKGLAEGVEVTRRASDEAALRRRAYEFWLQDNDFENCTSENQGKVRNGDGMDDDVLILDIAVVANSG